MDVLPHVIGIWYINIEKEESEYIPHNMNSRKDTRKTDMIIIAVMIFLAAMIFCRIVTPNLNKESDQLPENIYDSLESYDGKTMGTLAGSKFEDDTREHFPNSNILYFSTPADLYAALITHKIDAFAMNEFTMMQMSREHLDIDWLPEYLNTRYRYFGFSKTAKGEELCRQMDIMLAEYNANGTMDSLESKWYCADESLKVVDTSGLTGENGVLCVGISTGDEPYNYVQNNQYTGFNVDLVTQFAERYGYGIEYVDTDPKGLLLGITSGKFDMLATAISYSEERAQSILFSDPAMRYNSVLAVRSKPNYEEEKQGFFTKIADSFEKNFIRENRWMLIFQGLGITCLITALAAIFGTAFSFGLCMFRRTQSALANGIADLCVKVLQGTPIVVVLLILYYVVFSNSGLDAVWVAVIGFTLHFGAYNSETLRSGIEGIDPGQREAALALGHTENQAFFHFVLPLAIKRIMPVYRGEVITLLKGTAVAGYISVTDLTKMSDIIQSRTYEAFFPLIATAIIYFILSWLISMSLSLLMNRIDPRRRKGRVKNEFVKNRTFEKRIS